VKTDATAWKVSIASAGAKRLGLELSAPPPPSADYDPGHALTLRLDVREARRLARVLTAYADEADT